MKLFYRRDIERLAQRYRLEPGVVAPDRRRTRRRLPDGRRRSPRASASWAPRSPPTTPAASRCSSGTLKASVVFLADLSRATADPARARLRRARRLRRRRRDGRPRRAIRLLKDLDTRDRGPRRARRRGRGRHRPDAALPLPHARRCARPRRSRRRRCSTGRTAGSSTTCPSATSASRSPTSSSSATASTSTSAGATCPTCTSCTFKGLSRKWSRWMARDTCREARTQERQYAGIFRD